MEAVAGKPLPTRGMHIKSDGWQWWCSLEHRKTDMETGLLCAKNIISLPIVLCIEMKNATITVWLDQETEDKVAVGLTTVA